MDRMGLFILTYLKFPNFKIVTTYGNVSLIKDLIQIFHPFIKYLCFVAYGFHGFPFDFIANIHKQCQHITGVSLIVFCMDGG